MHSKRKGKKNPILINVPESIRREIKHVDKDKLIGKEKRMPSDQCRHLEIGSEDNAVRGTEKNETNVQRTFLRGDRNAQT